MRLIGLLTIAMLGLTGCGDEPAAPADDAAGGSGAGGAGGQGANPTTGGTGGAVDPGLTSASAPNETSIVVAFEGDLDLGIAGQAATYQLSSSVGPLAVASVAFDAASNRATLTTDKQKLGATYTLTLSAAGSPMDGQTASFPAADTARFWASDFNSADFSEYEIVADRLEIGQNCVVYLEQGMSVNNAAQTVDYFDNQIYPVETALYNPPGDLDENGKVLLLGLDGEGQYGGYFSPVNSLDNDFTLNTWGIHSNGMEMLYINVETGEFNNEQVVAHEYAHLLHNEVHDIFAADWPYHNEGLAECAVNAVNGSNDYAESYFFADPTGQIAQGYSLINWQWGNYDQYTVAYMFWSYLASRLGGVQAYGDIFVRSGDPDDIQAFVQSELGIDYATLQRDFLIALWAQAQTGPLGFEDVVDLGGNTPPFISGSSLSLEPFAGGHMVFPGQSSVNPSAGAGANILFVGVNGSGVADFSAPYDIAGGALVALNTRFEWDSFPSETTGLPIAALPNNISGSTLNAKQGLGSTARVGKAAGRSRAWMHPPPLHPDRLDQLRTWRNSTRAHQ